MEINKEEFKKDVKSNLRALFRKDIEEATGQQVFQAVAYAIKDYIVDMWIATHKNTRRRTRKQSITSRWNF